MAKIKKISKYRYIELEDVKGDDVWFASDFHFDHANIIRMCGRPFADVNEMNITLKQNWNSRIKPNDFMFILGDFCWSGDCKRWLKLLNELNGQKILIIGNHDQRVKNMEQLEKAFITIRERLELRIDCERVMLDHYPNVEWNGSFHGVKLLYGHIHEKDFPFAKPSQYNVSVERNGYRPISWNEINQLFDIQINNNISNLKIDAISNC